MPDSTPKKVNLLASGWSNVRSAGTQRLVVTGVMVLFALLLARMSWDWPLAVNAEDAFYDMRTVLLAEPAEQDDRVLMVVYDDQTLIKLQKRSPLDRGTLAEALKNLDGMGAKAIGIDILFDQPQEEDEQLIETLRGMQTPTFVAYAAHENLELEIEYEQDQYLKQFLARLEGGTAAPASIMLSNEGGVTRSWPPKIEGLPLELTRAMLAAAGEGDNTMPGYTGAIRYKRPSTEEAPVFTKLAIDLFSDPELAPAMAEAVEGRYVLIGGDVVDVDRVNTPFTNSQIQVQADQDVFSIKPPGLEIHAIMLAQMLDGKELPAIAGWTLWLLSLLVVLAGVLTGLLELRNWKVYPLLGFQFLVFLGVPFLLHARGVDTLGLPAFGWIAGWFLAFAAVTSAARASTAVQRQFAQGALGKYIPRSIAEELVEKPQLLSLHGEKKEIFVLFSDLEGFTKMSHALTPEMVAKLLNRYLEMLSQVVLDHGGVIDKFVGDAIVAFWGAPIAKEGDGERAAKCGYAIWQAGEAFRAEVAAMDPNLPKIGKTRVGLHWGEAVVGNFGGERRIQYTALGDSMNTAARLEAANKPLQSSVMASREFAELSGLDWWRPMGRVVLRGRARPVNLMEPAPEFPVQDRQMLEQAIELIDNNRAAAIELIEELVRRYPADTALENLLMRTKKLNEEGVYVLG
ncbi:MAG: adenylate/guanylate cyclase domain-containing protein [Sphingomonadaceae bacterium]|nr:adenylate/guanylate cyclase domain-containing protein [Sphingomonadaceae bacterium]